MNRKKLLFIYNPASGKGLLKPHLSDVIEVFMQRHYEVTIYATQKQGDATKWIEKLSKNYDRIVCSGGDGTVHEVIEGMMRLKEEDRRPCGYIPAGTVNDFANTINLPGKIMEDAVVAVTGDKIPYDIGCMNGEYFNYVAAFGAFTSVAYETKQAVKNIMGKVAYFLEGVMQVPNIPTYHIVIRGDHGEEYEDDFVFGMVTNTRSVGGIPVFRKVPFKVGDGIFEGVFIRKPKNPMEMQAVVNAFVTGSTNDQIVAFRSSKFEIFGKDISFTLDGEDGGVYDHIVIENMKKAITYVGCKDKS